MRTAFLRVTPESVGIPSSAIQAFVQATEERVGGLHSFMRLRHGQESRNLAAMRVLGTCLQAVTG